MKRFDRPKTGCWIWRGGRDVYGVITYKRQHYQAHRVVYELLKGPIPPEYQIHHACPNKRCVRPGKKHCSPVTQLENIQKGNNGAHNKRKTHCKNHHEFTPENTRLNARGWRVCKRCESEAHYSWVERGKPPHRPKEACVHGHRYIAGSFYRDRDGRRKCLICKARSNSEIYRRDRLKGGGRG